MSARHERGVALLAAILLVAFGTILAAAIAYSNAMSVRRATATFAFEQALLFAQGAEVFAGDLLKKDREDDGANPVDDRKERWAQAYPPTEIAPGVVLEAQIEDLAGRFNLNSLAPGGVIDEPAVEAFTRLLEVLELEPRWASLLADWIDTDQEAYGPEGAEDSAYLSQDPPYRAPNAPITSVSELLALPEFGRERYLLIAPHVAALPSDAQLNVCTASPVVLDAYRGQQREYSDADDFLEQQGEGCFPRADAYRATFDDPQAFQSIEAHPGIGESSSYFRLRSTVSIGTARFTLYSLLHRDQSGVRVLTRSYSPD